MIGYILHKLITAVTTLFGVCLIVFVLFNLVGGDPTYQMLGPHASEAQIAELRSEYGFDQPRSVQFVRYLKQVATFDYGKSYSTKQPVAKMIQDGLGPSLSLMLPAFGINLVIALSLALFVASRRGSWVDRAVVILSVFGMSVSILAFILFGQYFFAFKFGWFPISGYEAVWPDRIEFLIMPGVIFILVSLGYDVRFYRSAILDEVGQDYVRTARAKGLSERPIFMKHVLKNTLIPITTQLVSQIPSLILGAFLLESFFGIPGLGSITIEAIQNSDFPVIQAMTTFDALLLIGGNFLVDILYTALDPRVRLS